MLGRRIPVIAVVALASLAALEGCREEDLARPDMNRPPETVLSVAPQQGDRVFHRFLVRWTGLDRDGVVTRYKVATVPEDQLYGGRTSDEDREEYLLDLPWQVTDATESLFVFRADRPNSRNHSLYVVAIDNEGKEDPTPALTNFMAIDYELPKISIEISDNLNTEWRVPPIKGDTLPAYNLLNPDQPIFINLRWNGNDPDGEVVEWRYRLDSSTEVGLEPIYDSGCACYVGSKSFTYDPADSEGSDVWIGFHEFRVNGVDDANARSDQRSARFIINYDPNTVVDSVWCFRATRDKNGNPISTPLDTMLIFAREWRTDPDSAAKYADQRVGYHFGQLVMKFHGTDKDGPLDGSPPHQFKWSIKGTLLKSADWVSDGCGSSDGIDYYCATSPGAPYYLDSDRPFTLILTSRDNHGKADGSPDTMMFEVNYPPVIYSISHEVTNPAAGEVRFTWDAKDPDEGYGWGVAQGETEQALMKYRYRYRLKGEQQWGQWAQVTDINRTTRRYLKTATIRGLAPGQYELELHVYNGDYILTRADTMIHDFTIP